MAKDYQRLTFTGRLGKDPEMRFTPGGKAVTNFTVACNKVTKRDGEPVEETEWFNCVAWEQLAEICDQYLTKGSRVLIEGELKTRSWVDATSGETKYRTEVIASQMVMLDTRTDGERTSAAPARTNRPAAAPAPAANRRPAAKQPPLGDDADIPF